MKRFTTLLLSLLLTTALFANPVDPQKAGEIANAFWGETSKSCINNSLELIPRAKMSKAGSRFTTPRTAPGYYIFTPGGEQGFVIVSGEDALSPIIGYSTTANISEMPPALRDLLDVYDTYVDDLRNGAAELAQPVTTAANSYIEPMLTTKWNQSDPYNKMCPEYNGQKTPTGCTATAIAQIMKFHNWPDKPSKEFTWTNNITEKEETVAIHTYDWKRMKDSYNGSNTPSEEDAVAQLMADVGKAINSQYAPTGTGSTPIDASQALVNVFKYSPDIVVANREEYTNEEYISLIRTNLEARQPLMYAGHGQSYSSGHAFVCDGIDENNLLHINWGWGGAYDGWFDITTMAPGGAGIGGGEERYNVGQSIIANIRPRATDEAGVNGEPTLYASYILNPDTNPDNNEEYQLVDEAVKTFVNGKAKQRVAFALVNFSHSASKMQIALHFEKDGELYDKWLINSADELVELEMNEESEGAYVIDFIVSNSTSNDSYLEEGVYNLKFYYSDGSEGGEFKPIRGSQNNITLEVGNKQTRIYQTKPQIKMTEFTFRQNPTLKGDRLSFDAKFENQNKRNSLVLIVPVLNREISENEYESQILDQEGVLIDVYDDEEIFATFDTNTMFPQDGKYYISFVCNVQNRYTSRNLKFDHESITPITGQSQEVNISPLPEGLVLSTTALSATAITYGEKANIAGEIKNISTSDTSFTGTLGLFATNNATGQAYLLETLNIEELKKDETKKITYNNPDYFPVMQPGTYTITVQQLENGVWKEMRQSAAPCIQDIAATNAIIPYIKGTIEINNGNDVVKQGEVFEVKATFSCFNGDFEGLARVNIPNGVSYHVRSDFSPISVKKDETVDVVFKSCKSFKSTPLNKYRLNITYNNAEKKKIGDVSNNTLSYSGNGYFWIGDDTAIEVVEDVNGAEITVCDNIISIANADDAVVTIYSSDGRKLHQGTETAIQIANGLYIITVQKPNGTITATKVFVK